MNYKDDLARTERLDRRLCAKKLVEEAGATRGNPASRYALLKLASETASSCGDIWTAARAIFNAEQGFSRAPGDSMRSRAIAAARLSCSSSEEWSALAGSFLLLVDDAVSRDDHTQAALWAKEAAAVAKQSGSPTVVRAAQEAVSDVPERRKLHEKAVKADLALAASDKNDPAAALDLGLYLLSKRNIDRALPLLAKSSHKGVAAAATLEGQSTPDGEAGIALAEKWIDAAKGLQGAAARTVRAHGGEILKSCMKLLSGASKARAENRLQEAL